MIRKKSDDLRHFDQQSRLPRVLMLILLAFPLQELELRIETQKQTLQARDESIKKLLEMLQNKGMGEALLAIPSRYIN